MTMMRLTRPDGQDVYIDHKAVDAVCLRLACGNLECRADGFVVPTLEGEMFCRVGDWLIRGVHGECYPCKPEIFAATYEAVE